MLFKKKVIFLHPDLGIGGAERLVVDAALVLKLKGYNVSFITSHHDKNHCFIETRNGHFNVKVVGGWIPRSLLGSFCALFAYIKMIYCAFYIIFNEHPDMVFCDLVPVCIPILRLTVKKIIYYCHYPDQLLSKQGGFLKYIYRIPLNWLEEKSISCADLVYVNSEFTKTVYTATFSSISKRPIVLYPSVDLEAVLDKQRDYDSLVPERLRNDKFVFLSINRYERKKHVELVVKALKSLNEKLLPKDWNKVMLVLAGGYDTEVLENVRYFDELNWWVHKNNLEEKVLLLKTLSDLEKIALLTRCNCLVYTAPNEHFGIVPLEAMMCRKPVIACDSGGPKETIVNGETGILCDFTVDAFADAMLKLIQEKDLAKTMGEQGYERIIEKFCYATFSDQLGREVKTLIYGHSELGNMYR